MRSRTDLENIEAETLAAFAQLSRDSSGRATEEAAHPLRTAFQRDRARIIHSKAFRRLESKTQVFVSGSADHVRNRLTHSIEVANIGRSIGRSLGLNEDLIEAVALAHDLGHSPAGHAGEEALAGLMRGHGGFDHNAQSLRVVELLEVRSPHYSGLNLSAEVLEGLHKHDRTFLHPRTGRECPSPSLEAQVADLADEIAYYSHDLEDGLRMGILQVEHLGALELWRATKSSVPGASPTPQQVLRALVDREVDDVVETTSAGIEAAGVRSVTDVRNHPVRLVCYSTGLASLNRNMRKFLYKNLYYHPFVQNNNRAGVELIRRVFTTLVGNPSLLSENARARVATDGLHRAVCDYIAGMTDGFLRLCEQSVPSPA